MAITFVGSHVGTHAATSAQTVNFSSLLNDAGGTPTLAQGDIVYVAVENAHTAQITNGNLVPSGYTSLHTADYRNDTYDSNFQVSYKVMGATPDTSVAIPASASTASGVGYAIYVFRGVNTASPNDATVVVTGGTNTGVANAAAITPVTAGAWVVVFAGSAVAAGAVYTNPAGMSTTTNHFRTATITSTTNDANIGGALYTSWTSGSYDPAAFGGSTSTNTGSWSAVTLALRPLQAVTLDAESGSYTVTGQSNTDVIDRVIDAASSSYSLSGQDVTFNLAQFSELTYAALQNEDGTYILTEAGDRILLEPYQISVNSASGVFTVTGQDTTVAYTTNAQAGSYSLTGQLATKALVENAQAGTYTVTGQPAYSSQAELFEAGSYALTGYDADLSVTIVASSYTLKYYDVTQGWITITKPPKVYPDVPYVTKYWDGDIWVTL